MVKKRMPNSCIGRNSFALTGFPIMIVLFVKNAFNLHHFEDDLVRHFVVHVVYGILKLVQPFCIFCMHDRV